MYSSRETSIETSTTTAAATAAMKPQANVAEVTAGEVAAVDGSAATPAEAATVSTSHTLLTTLHTLSSSFVFFIQKRFVVFLCATGKKVHAVYSNRIKKTPKNVGPPLGLINN